MYSESVKKLIGEFEELFKEELNVKEGKFISDVSNYMNFNVSHLI